MNEEWLSAHLDGELSADEQRELDAVLASDGELARIHDDLARVRATLRRAAAIEPPAGALDRISATVASADDTDGGAGLAPVVSLTRRRRVPTLAAAAAAFVIIASVVGGLGSAATIPALGQLLEQHEAAAAMVEGAPMPSTMESSLMPMDEAAGAALPMPDELAMEYAFVDGGLVHLVYRTADGHAVSVFRQQGDADMGQLGDGTRASSDEADMWAAAMDETPVVVVDGSGYFWVVFGMAPDDEMAHDLMYDLPTRSPSLGERLRDVADAAVEPFRFWD